MSPLLEMRSITKEYRGVAAVNDVSFALETGEIHALVGENGAGKSTLTRVQVRRRRGLATAAMMR